MSVSPVRKVCALSLNRILTGESSLEAELSTVRATEKGPAQKTATFLLKGVVERSETLSAMLKKLTKLKESKMDLAVRSCLYLGIYELMFSASENYAVTNEYVNLVKELNCGSASGFVNGILRTVTRTGSEVFESLRISEKLSIPEAIWLSLSKDYTVEERKTMFEWFLSSESKRLTIRRNASRCSEEELKEELQQDRAEIFSVKLPDSEVVSEDVCELRTQKPIDTLSAYQKGMFYVQDLSSSLAGDALSDLFASQGTKYTVLDVASAPGGKSLHLYDMAVKTGNFVEITACDISEDRLAPLRENIDRFGFTNIHPMVSDGTVLRNEFIGKFDIVLCDVPCSGLGCLSGRPDIRLRTTKESLSEITLLQKEILENAQNYVKKGGTLLYSTCTMRKAENEKQIEPFLASHPEFVSVYEKTYLPGINTTGDGFYIHRLKRQN